MQPEMMPILEPGNKNVSSNLPAHVRLDFIRKVYGLLCTMLLITFGLASPFVFNEDVTNKFMMQNPWIPFICSTFFLLQVFLHFAMGCEACFGGSVLWTGYIRMFVTVPWNYLYCFSFAACMGVVVGLICSAYTASSVCFVFLLTAGIIASLTYYAVTTEADFTGMGPYVFVMVAALILFQVMWLCFAAAGMSAPGDPIHRIIAGLGAMLFGFIIVYDTQLICGGKHSRYRFSVDEYCFAALNLYMDIINLFLHLLRIMGDRR